MNKWMNERTNEWMKLGLTILMCAEKKLEKILQFTAQNRGTETDEIFNKSRLSPCSKTRSRRRVDTWQYHRQVAVLGYAEAMWCLRRLIWSLYRRLLVYKVLRHIHLRQDLLFRYKFVVGVFGADSSELFTLRCNSITRRHSFNNRIYARKYFCLSVEQLSCVR